MHGGIATILYSVKADLYSMHKSIPTMVNLNRLLFTRSQEIIIIIIHRRSSYPLCCNIKENNSFQNRITSSRFIFQFVLTIKNI